ncbi:uncharacterized protein EI90DRAFT_3108029 [Cantharellus anzutake]|uniref:uncharacterized protein n=1 Tax=Cantharellus anzutake TaxID=1750568 RepID=UPI001904FC8E|nr:uncharacterized protein EI90DRAFT_3108029 [Cantharellus anzutake]KAF8308715.1 hypothetical protein EI90DRAFT_3108029 [Cantharellus anzutake]
MGEGAWGGIGQFSLVDTLTLTLTVVAGIAAASIFLIPIEVDRSLRNANLIIPIVSLISRHMYIYSDITGVCKITRLRVLRRSKESHSCEGGGENVTLAIQ